jgi:hypothetical protein
MIGGRKSRMKNKHTNLAIMTTHVLRMLNACASGRGILRSRIAYTQPSLPMTDLRSGNTKFEIEVALALGMEAFV